jgi:hypothetical protein
MKRNYSWSLAVAGAVVLTTFALIGDGRLWGQKAENEDIAIAAGGTVFLLDVSGDQMGEFSLCSGLGSSNLVDTATVVLPSGMEVLQQAPGVLQRHRITLRGMGPGSPAAWQWRTIMDSGGFNAAVREGQITMFEAGSSQPVAAWVFHKGWPASLIFEAGELKLEIIHEGLEMVGAGGGVVAPKARTK